MILNWYIINTYNNCECIVRCIVMIRVCWTFPLKIIKICILKNQCNQTGFNFCQSNEQYKNTANALEELNYALNFIIFGFVKCLKCYRKNH